MSAGRADRGQVRVWSVVAALSFVVLGSCTDEPRTKADPVSERPRDPAARDLARLDLVLDFDQDIGVVDDIVPTATSRGQVPVQVHVTTASGGVLAWAKGVEGGTDRAIRTPSYAPEGEVPAAALVIVPNAAVEHLLDPGTADVLIGADFSVDEPGPGRPEDDGDNLVQRGRDGEAAMVKIQVDRGVPSCRMVGEDADVFVEASTEVAPDHWYRIECTRSDGTVRLRLWDLEAPGSLLSETANSAEDPGAMWFGSTRFSVGAKINEEGVIDPLSVDQFNGVIDRVVYDVG